MAGNLVILRDMPKKNRAAETTTVGLVQMSCDPKPEVNLKKAIAGINDAAKRGASSLSQSLTVSLARVQTLPSMP